MISSSNSQSPHEYLLSLRALCAVVCYDSHFPSHFHHHSAMFASFSLLISFYIDNLVALPSPPHCTLTSSAVVPRIQHTQSRLTCTRAGSKNESERNCSKHETTTTQDATKINGPLAHLHFCFTVKKKTLSYFSFLLFLRFFILNSFLSLIYFV